LNIEFTYLCSTTDGHEEHAHYICKLSIS